MIPGLSQKDMLEWYRGRVRELEAELMSERRRLILVAEESEARVAEWRQFREKMFVANSEGAFNIIHALRDSLRETKARVAELERELQFAIDLLGPEYPGMWIAHEAREREAE